MFPKNKIAKKEEKLAKKSKTEKPEAKSERKKDILKRKPLCSAFAVFEASVRRIGFSDNSS